MRTHCRAIQILLILFSLGSPWTAAAQSQGAKKSLEDLEREYWRKKDLSPNVVQNRAFSKDGAFSVGLSLGSMISDPILEGTTGQLELHYFFTEEHGISLGYEAFQTGINDFTKNFIDRFGLTSPDHNIPKSMVHLSYSYYPIYGKLSLLKSKIIYYDLGVSIGYTHVNLDQQRVEGPNPTSASGFHIDLRQYFYLTSYFALSGAIRNVWSQQERVRFSPSISGQPRTLDNVLWTNTQINIGGAFFFK